MSASGSIERRNKSSIYCIKLTPGGALHPKLGNFHLVVKFSIKILTYLCDCNKIGLAFGKQECDTMLKTGKIAIPSLSLHENELVHNKPTALSYSSSVKSILEHFFKYCLACKIVHLID